MAYHRLDGIGSSSREWHSGPPRRLSDLCSSTEPVCMRETADGETIEAAWRKAREISGLPGSIWRRDRFGMTIRRFDYGDTGSDFGWVVDRILIALVDATTNSRLQPLQWRNSSLGPHYPASPRQA